MESLKVNIKTCRYKALIGVGGIGSGMFFQLNGDHTLGREESRSGYFLDRKDYCKLHIIAHYVKILLGTNFEIIAVGKVGADDVGKRLMAEMKETGFELSYVEESPNDQTLFSFCFIYPDGSGGNMTTSDSACSKVDTTFVEKVKPKFAQYPGQGMALAAPEVPLDARARLLELATDHHFFRAASFTSEEIKSAVKSELLGKVDLLGVNLDEAAAAAGMSVAEHKPESIIESAIRVFVRNNPRMIVSITKGKDGSWSWDGSSLTHMPVFPVKVQNTAGAGDAHLGGFMVGLTAGLSVQEAHQLAALTSASSVESPHTINKKTGKRSLRTIADRSNITISRNVYLLLEE